MLPGLPKNTRSPGCRCERSTGVPLPAANWASVTRGIWMPAFAYAHGVRPEQSKPVCGVEPPQRYAVPLYFSASLSAASAFGPALPPPPAALAAASAAAAGGGGGGGAVGGGRDRCPAGGGGRPPPPPPCQGRLRPPTPPAARRRRCG